MTISERPTVVGVRPAEALHRHHVLFDALEAGFAVRFVAAESGEPLPAVVVVGEGDPSPTAEISAQTERVLCFVAGASAASDAGDVELLSNHGLDRRLRGTVLPGQAIGEPLRPEDGDETLAASDGRPIWTCRAGSPRVDRVAAPLPTLEEGTTLIDTLHAHHSVGLVALVHLLRAVEADRWTKPGLRAAFVIDDPNLRRDCYGYVNYPELVRHADRHGYHIAMAMIPLDVRHWSRHAAALFRERPDRLSLVMHGNDHYGPEMATTEGLPGALAMAAQAVRRIAWFECRAALPVDRVMIAPHESWSRDSARALGALDYDALSACQASPTTEDTTRGPALKGWTPAAFVDGCAVVPRFPWSMHRTSVALRAFLDHPLILYGHHNDLASGLEPLERAAAVVSSLGDVRWTSVGEIVHRNYELQITDGTIAVRPWGRSLRVTVPDSCRELTVVEPFGPHPAGLSGWTLAGADGSVRPFGARVPVSGGEVSVRLHSDRETDDAMIASPSRSVLALARRRFTEARDRLAPLAALAHGGVPGPGSTW